jgi:Dolichyl-phosphate-mannose-protein mannosyltransferase
LPRSERLLLIAAAATSLLLRAVALVRYRFDSDEPQHLHVAWGWTQGLVQYRDLFDNHTPLFHIVTAPLLALAGERSDVLIWMRIPMLALFAIVLWATWWIARELYDERVAAWAAVLLSLFPPFFLKSLEFRTDNLWNTLWVLAVVAVMRRRFFLAGLLLGGALAVSMKTILLIVTLGGAALLTFRRVDMRVLARAAAGFVIVPAILAIYFASAGAWDELVYCVFTFNGQVAATRPNAWIGRAIFPFTLAIVLTLAWRWRRSDWRYFFAVAIGIFTVTLAGFWILISTRDFLPIMPLLAIFAAAGLLSAAEAAASTRIAIALLVSIAVLYRYADGFENRTEHYTTMIDQLLRVSRPGEPILDYKGELVFRRRATYPIFEAITRAQMIRGMIADTIPEDVVRKRVYVAQADGPMWPPRGRAFLSENFINLGRLRAAGQWIREDGTFTIAIPGEYVIVSERAAGPPQQLGAGTYRYARRERAAVVWAPAIARGHSPFRLRDLDF